MHLRGTVLDIGGMDGEKRRGEVCVCGRHTWLERYIDRCVPKRRSRGGLHTPRVNDLSLCGVNSFYFFVFFVEGSVN